MILRKRKASPQEAEKQEILLKRSRILKPLVPEELNCTQEELNQFDEAITNLAASIKNGSPVDTTVLEDFKPYFKQAIEEWKEEDSELNLLQLASLYGNTEIVEILSEEFEYHKPELASTNSVEDNSAIHLACLMGHLNILKFLLLSSASNKDLCAMLEKKSVLHIDKLMTVHRRLFRTRNKCRYNTHTQRKNQSEENKAVESKESNTVAKTPLEISAEAARLNCSMFLADLIFQNTKIARNARTNISPLHMACYLQVPAYIELLLKDDVHRSRINALDSSGKHPLLITLKNQVCLEVLLRHGADPSTVTYRNKSLLLWLITEYSDIDKWKSDDESDVCVRKVLGTTITPDILETARLLLNYGADVNYFENHLTSSSFVWRLNKKHNALCRSNKKQSPFYTYKTVLEEITTHYVKTKKFLDNDGCFKDFIALLLDHGADTMINQEPITSPETAVSKHTSSTKMCNRRRQNEQLLNTVDRTVVHTLLESSDIHNLGLFFKAQDSKYAYTIMKLLFDHGLDANLVPINDCNILQLFFNNIFGFLDARAQRSFLHLLFINGTDFNTVPKPNTSYKCHHIRSSFGFKMLPLVQAFGNYYKVEVLRNIMEFMSATAIQTSWTQLNHFIASGYDSDLEALRESYTVRTLCHLSKLAVMSCLGKQGAVKAKKLFIPEILKMYLVCNVF